MTIEISTIIRGNTKRELALKLNKAICENQDVRFKLDKALYERAQLLDTNRCLERIAERAWQERDGFKAEAEQLRGVNKTELEAEAAALAEAAAETNSGEPT